ncbi:MAG TPA: hypothetical protein PLF48_03095 [Chitinophagales bacterium]|nr:hypothetical protein [Chitinophagales bacterium]
MKTNDMGIDLNKLKSLFIVTDETNKTETTDNSSNQQTTNDSTSQQVVTNTTGGQADNSIIETLFKAMSENNVQGFDYFEYKQSLKTLLGMLDESTAFKSAYATAATMGLTKQKLIDSANFYIKVLDKEKEKFTQAVDAQVAANIKGKESEIEQAKNQINEKSEMIRKLTDEISALQQKMNEIQSHIIQATQKIQATSANFEASYQKIASDIKADVAKINQHIN